MTDEKYRVTAVKKTAEEKECCLEVTNHKTGKHSRDGFLFGAYNISWRIFKSVPTMFACLVVGGLGTALSAGQFFKPKMSIRKMPAVVG